MNLTLTTEEVPQLNSSLLPVKVLHLRVKALRRLVNHLTVAQVALLLHHPHTALPPDSSRPTVPLPDNRLTVVLLKLPRLTELLLDSSRRTVPLPANSLPTALLLGSLLTERLLTTPTLQHLLVNTRMVSLLDRATVASKTTAVEPRLLRHSAR